MKREALRVTSTIPVAPTTLYFAWIDSEHHSSMTGQSAKLEPAVGAKFSALDGYVGGKLVILDLGRRIVMSWRTNDFPREAPDSRVEVHFETLGVSTRVLILHTDIPEGHSERYKTLWNDKYLGPMRTYFSKFLPDPRNPPVRRPPPPPAEGGDDEPIVEERPQSKLGQLRARLAEKKAKAAAAAAAKAAAKPARPSTPPPVAAPVAASAPTPAPTPAPAAKGSGPGVHKAETKPAKAEKPTKAEKPATAKKAAAPPAKAAKKAEPAPKKAAAKKPAPAKKKAAPAKKPVAPAPKKKAAPKKPAAKKAAPKKAAPKKPAAKKK